MGCLVDLVGVVVIEICEGGARELLGGGRTVLVDDLPQAGDLRFHLRVPLLGLQLLLGQLGLEGPHLRGLAGLVSGAGGGLVPGGHEHIGGVLRLHWRVGRGTPGGVRISSNSIALLGLLLAVLDDTPFGGII